MWHQDASRSPNGDTQPRYTGQERRTSPRIQTPFSATVRSVEVNDQPFEEHTVLDNLGSGGLYLRLAHQVREGIRLFVLMQFSISPDADATVAWIELHGMVLRTESRPGGVFGTAIRFTHYRFIYATTQSITATRRADPIPMFRATERSLGGTDRSDRAGSGLISSSGIGDRSSSELEND